MNKYLEGMLLGKGLKFGLVVSTKSPADHLRCRDGNEHHQAVHRRQSARCLHDADSLSLLRVCESKAQPT